MTEGNAQWDPIHTSTARAANRLGESIYWIAPTHEDDFLTQIALVDKVVDGRYRGLVLAPDRTLPLILPVRRALAHGISTVILNSSLPISPDPHLRFVLNDDESGARMAAERIAQRLHGHGNVALLGINPDLSSVMIRARSFEEVLTRKYPGVHIVDRRAGSFSVPHEQQVAEEILRQHPKLDAVVCLMWASVDGFLLALPSSPRHSHVLVAGFDSWGWPPPFDNQPNLDFVIEQNNSELGEKAIECIAQMNAGHSPPEVQRVMPILVTRENLDSDQILAIMSSDWKLGKWRWKVTR